MTCYKVICDEYIIAIGETNREVINPITRNEYDQIKTVLDDKPIAPQGKIYRLKTDLTWVLDDAPVAPDDSDNITDSDAINVLLGGAE